MPTPCFLLFITSSGGSTHVESFPSAFDRALRMIGLAEQSVVLRVKDYEGS